MTELRQKMIRAMELKNLSPHTQRAYLAAATGLARHYRQSPVGITKEMIEDYRLLLKNSRASNSCGLVLTGLRSFLLPRGRRKTARRLPLSEMSAISHLMSRTDTMMGPFNLIGTYMLQNVTCDVPSGKIEDREGFGNG